MRVAVGQNWGRDRMWSSVGTCRNVGTELSETIFVTLHI